METCNDKDLTASFTRFDVRLTCRKCGLITDLPQLVYLKKWGYPKGQETISVSEWLHKAEKEVGRENMEKILVTFRDVVNNVDLGRTPIPFGAIEKLAVGDYLEFKDQGVIFGMYMIQSFAINQGHPDGAIELTPVKAKAKIKLQVINEQYVDSLFPF
jgi:hypothetical protein